MVEEGEKWLKTRLIIEIAGFPEEHINNTLKLLAEKFGAGQKKSVKVTKRDIKEAKKVSDKMFSGFVELWADVDTLATLVGLMFDYMPSSVEILEPDNVVENIQNLNAILNDLAARLHQYDAVVKTLKAKNIILSKELAKYKPKEEKKG